MPYINVDGKLVEVTREQFDIYTIGQNQTQVGTTQTPAEAAAAVAAGGTVTATFTSTAEILTPNTTNNTPGQQLTVTYPSVSSNVTSTNFGSSVQTFDDGTTLQTFDDGSVLATGTDGAVTSSPSPTEDPQTLARAGLTADQLALLGAADATDPYIRARLGLPALSEVQTLSGAIGNIDFSNIANVAISSIKDVAGSVGNAISDLFSSSTPNAVPASDVATSPLITNAGTSTQTFDDGTTLQTFDDGSILATGTDGSITSAPAPTDAGTTTTVNDTTGTVTQTNDAGNQVTTIVPEVAIDTGPVAVSSAVDPQASLAPGETIVPDTVDAGLNTTASNVTPGDATGYNPDVAPADIPVSAEVLNPEPTNYGASVQTFDDGTTLQTFDDGSVLATDTAGGVSAASIDTAPADTNYGASIQTFDDGTTLQTFDDGSVLATDTNGDVTSSPAPVDPTIDEQAGATQDAEDAAAGVGAGTANTGTGTSASDIGDMTGIQGQVKNAQAQATIASQRKQINNGDWRVRLRLAPQSNYLYNAPQPGILQPLKVTDGIIFPYTPAITTAYRANYSNYDLTHSNYRGYFYQNSYVDAVNLTATFTAQDTNDANYLLAVIHFLRSATKMFYGQDAQRGSPPPVVYLTGLGDYQFREHSCLISQFQYNLPADVDYIRAGSPNQVGLNLTSIRDRQSVATNSIFGTANRLAAAFLPKGALNKPPAPPTLGLNRPTYVPTKMEIQLTLLPIQSRQQVSKQFSLKEFANGNLLKGGFW